MNGEVVWFGLGVQCFCAGMFRNRKFICAMERNSAENKIVSSICCVLLQIFICSQISHEWHTFLHTKHFESNFSPSAVYCDKFSLFPLELSSRWLHQHLLMFPQFHYFDCSLCVFDDVACKCCGNEVGFSKKIMKYIRVHEIFNR